MLPLLPRGFRKNGLNMRHLNKCHSCHVVFKNLTKYVALFLALLKGGLRLLYGGSQSAEFCMEGLGMDDLPLFANKFKVLTSHVVQVT